MNICKLKSLIKIKNGTRYSHLDEGEIPVYGSGGIMCYVNNYLYNGEAILLPRKGTLNNIMYTNGKIWTVDTMYYAISNSEINMYYLYCYLSLLNLSHLDSGSALPSMTQLAYYDIKVKLPALNAQKQAASILLALEKQIELNMKIHTELETMIKTLYNYWFVQFDFPDDKGNPYKSSRGKIVYSQELKREMPIGWRVEKISSLILENKGGDWGKETITGNYTCKVSCVRGADINFINGKNANSEIPTRYILEKNSEKILSEGDIIIEMSGGSPSQSTGRAALITEKTLERFDNPLICSNFCQSIRMVDKDYSFWFFYMWKMFYKNDIFFNHEGKTSGIKNLLFDMFVNSTNWYIPPSKIIQKFNSIVSKTLEKKELLLKQNQELSTLRNWLLPMLMNGQVTIKEVEQENSQKRIIPLDAHILGGHIVKRLHGTKGMGRTKLQKSLHLIEYHCQLPLKSEASQFAAGPHDEEMMKYIDDKLKQYKQAQIHKTRINGKPHYEYTPTPMMQEIEQAYQTYSSGKRSEIDMLLDKIACMDLSRAEIISTLYAVWNNRLLKKQEITDTLLLLDFYAWSKHKSNFQEELIIKGLNYMKRENIIPLGWGRYIDKRKK